MKPAKKATRFTYSPVRQDILELDELGWQLNVPPGQWLLLAGPRLINTTMLEAISRLGRHAQVRVMDGGNRFNAYKVARFAHGRPDVLNRITVSRAFTCYQMVSLLESTPAIPIPFVILDMLSTFYDDNVTLGERKRLLHSCISHLERLEKVSSGVVSVHPSAVSSQGNIDLLQMLQEAAGEIYYIQAEAPALEQEKLF
jgi:hypothetical protein